MLRQEEGELARTGRPKHCNPVCYMCTEESIHASREQAGSRCDAVYTEDEWREHQVHMDRLDAVTCTRAQHGTGGSAPYCGPPVGVATVCGVCFTPRFISGLPRPMCPSCGVPYTQPVKGTYEPKNRKAAVPGFSRTDLIAATMTALAGGGGDWVQRETQPDKMQEALYRAWLNPRDDMLRYPRLAVMIYCGVRLQCGLHPEFDSELRDKGGRYRAPFTSIPHMDLALHVRLFQPTADRNKPLRVKTRVGGSVVPSESELRAQAVEDLKNLKEWPWKKDPHFEYEAGVTILLGATGHYFSFLVNLFGEGFAPDFAETFETLQTMLSSPSFGRKLNKAEFYCNVAVAEWAHRMRNEFDPESNAGSGLYRHELEAGATVPRVFLSPGLRSIVELHYHTAMREMDTKDDFIFPRSGEAAPVPSVSAPGAVEVAKPALKSDKSPGKKPTFQVSGENAKGGEPGGIPVSVKSEGFVPVKPKFLERNHTQAVGVRGAERVCLDFQTAAGCPLPNCSSLHVHTKLTVDQYLYCLGLRGYGHLEAGVLRCSMPGHEAKGKSQMGLMRSFLGVLQDVSRPGRAVIDTSKLAERELGWVEVKRLFTPPVPLCTRGGLEIVSGGAIAVGMGPCIMVGSYVDVGSRIATPAGDVGRQCVLRSLVADLEPPPQPTLASPSDESTRGKDGSDDHATEILRQVLQQLGEIDVGRMPIDSEIAASYVSSVQFKQIGWGENLLDLVNPPILAKYNILFVSAASDSVTFRYYPSGGTHNGKAVPTGCLGKAAQYAGQAAGSECIAVVCRPTETGGRHCTPLHLSQKDFTHNKIIGMLDRYSKSGEPGVYVAALQRGGFGVYDNRTRPGSASAEQLRKARTWFRSAMSVEPGGHLKVSPPDLGLGSPPSSFVPVAQGVAADPEAPSSFARELQTALENAQAKLDHLDQSESEEAPEASVFEETLGDAKRVCNRYFRLYVGQAKAGELPRVTGAGEHDGPERIALLYMRRLFVAAFYGGWAGDKSFYEANRTTVESALSPEHGKVLWDTFTKGCRSSYVAPRGSDRQGVWFPNHPSAETPDARRAIARDMAKQLLMHRGMVFDDSDPEVARWLVAAGVCRSPLATAEKHLEDGQPAMDSRYPRLQKLRTIIDASVRGDDRAPNAGIFPLSLLKQQTTDIERCIMAVLRVESQGGLIEGSKEDVKDAFRLITTEASEFGNIAIGLPGLVYVPLSLAFGMRHSPSAFEVLSRAVEEVYYRSREVDGMDGEECWESVQRFVDDYFQVVNTSEVVDADVRREKLREAVLAVCGPEGLNEEKSKGGRTKLPVFGVFFDLLRRVVYPNPYKVQKFVELARPFVNGETRHLSLEQAEKLQGLGNFVFQTTPGIMAAFQSRISAMLARGATVPAKFNRNLTPSPALQGEDEEQGWRALRSQLHMVCELAKFQESRLLVKPLEAGLRMNQRLGFPGRETAANLQEYLSDAALKGLCAFWNGFFVRGEYSQGENEKFELAQRRWCESMGNEARCINFRELHTAVVLSCLVAPRHPGSIVRFAIDNRAAEAWLQGSGTDLQHVELLLTVNSVVQFLLGIDATSRYVRSEENRFMDVGSRFDAEEEFQGFIAEWERGHGRKVEQLTVPAFLRGMGMRGEGVSYGSSPEMWVVLAKLMQHWKENKIGPYGPGELDQLTEIFERCGSQGPLPDLPMAKPEEVPTGPSPVRVALGKLRLTRASVLKRLMGGIGKRELPGDVPCRTVLERRDSILRHQWEQVRGLLEVPTVGDHKNTFTLPEGVPRTAPGGIRLWENFCGQSTFGKAVEDSNGGVLVGYTETDPYCRTHLGRVFPNAKGLRDHREATARVLRILKVNLFVTSPPCMEHSQAHRKRKGGRSETGSWYAGCADEAIKAGVDHIIVECTVGVQERNGCAQSPLEILTGRLHGAYHVQVLTVDTPTVRSPFNGYVAPVHHTRQYVVATSKSFRAAPMEFRVSTGEVLARNAEAIVGRLSLGPRYQAMPEHDVRQLERGLRRGGAGNLRQTIQCVARVSGSTRGEMSEGNFRLRVINPVKGLFTTFTGAVGGDWIVDTLGGRTVVRKPTLPEMVAAYGLRGLAPELEEPCEALQSMVGNAVPAPVGDAFVSQVLLDRERDGQGREPIRKSATATELLSIRDVFVQGWVKAFRGPSTRALPHAQSCGGRDEALPRAQRSGGLDPLPKVKKVIAKEPRKCKGIERLIGSTGVVNVPLLQEVRQHANEVMLGGINADSRVRYEASLKSYREFCSAVGKEPLYAIGWGGLPGGESHLAYQRHVVEYLSFLHLVNQNAVSTLRSKLSHLSWAHTASGRDDPLKKHTATYVEAWVRALDRREPRNAAGKRPATPELLMMVFMNISRFARSKPLYCLSMWAAVLTAWAFMLRSREYVAVPERGSRPMRWKQVVFRGRDGAVLLGREVVKAERMTLRIPSTKNGLQEVTRSIKRSESVLCCVSALINLHSALQARSDWERTLHPEAPVFVVDIHSTPLRREDVNLGIEASAVSIYGEEKAKAFRSHSLRHGGASAYAAAGVPLHVIKEFGRWKSEAFMVYITLAVEVLDEHLGKVHAGALLLEERRR